jgi:hypothetical protein
VSWVKLDDALFSHPKVLRAGNEATGAWIRMLAYCAAYLTDGVIDADTALSLAGRQKVIDRLVTARLLDRDGDTLRVHDYLAHNPSRVQVLADRAAKTERQSRWRAKLESDRATVENTGKTVRVDASTRASHDASTGASRDGSGDAAPLPLPLPLPSHSRPEEPRRSASHSTGARERAPASAREGLLEDALKAPARAAKARAVATPLPDPVPAAGTPARRLYDAIITDRVLGPITRGPGDLAERLSQVDAYPGIDVLAEVKRAGAWVAGKPAGHWSDGRKALLGWLARTAERAASTPKPAPITKGWVPAKEAWEYGDGDGTDIDFSAPPRPTGGRP